MAVNVLILDLRHTKSDYATLIYRNKKNVVFLTSNLIEEIERTFYDFIIEVLELLQQAD